MEIPGSIHTEASGRLCPFIAIFFPASGIAGCLTAARGLEVAEVNLRIFERTGDGPRITGVGMKILLRNQRTKLYYAGGNDWRSDPDCAIEFSSSLSAWKLVLRGRIGDDLEIVYLFGGREESFSVTIEPPQRGWS